MLLSHTFGMVSTKVMKLFGWHVVGVVKNLSGVAGIKCQNSPFATSKNLLKNPFIFSTT